MTVKVSDVMRQLRNHFVRDAVTGDWAHADGVLTPAANFAPGMWIAVTGPGAPTGVYQLDENGGIPDLQDTAWQGTVYRLDPPADFIRLCGDIGCWAAAYESGAITSEKFGAYSVSRKFIPWAEAFAPALKPYQRMFSEVQV